MSKYYFILFLGSEAAESRRAAAEKNLQTDHLRADRRRRHHKSEDLTEK